MVLLTTTALLGALLFGGLGCWANDYSVVPLMTAIYGACISGALVLMIIFVREVSAPSERTRSRQHQ
jgi:hypothetical protein